MQNNLYSVPTHLIGQQVTVHLAEWQLTVSYRHTPVAHLPRLVGQNKLQLNYRHLIDSLLRKPGGFRNYRYREAMFPSLIFRQAWEQLEQWYSPRQADLIYLRVLHLAARTMECEVAAGLAHLVAAGQRWDERELTGWVTQPQPDPSPGLTPLQVDLEQYDRLLQEQSYVPA